MDESCRNKLCHGIQSSNDGASLDKGPLKALKNGLRIGATNVLLITAITRETVACERQTFLLAHRLRGTFREAERRSSSRNVPQRR